MSNGVDPRVIEKLRRLMAQDPRAAEKLARLMGAPPAVDPVVGEMIRDSSYGATFDGVPAIERLRGGGPGVYEDDWQRQLAQIGEAAALHPGDALDQDIAVKRQRLKESEALAPYVRTQPRTAHGIIYGAQAVVSSGQISGDLVYWSGDDDECQPVTITAINLGTTGGLTWPAATSAASDISYRPYARVRWGTRGFQTSVDVDIGQQVCVTGAAVYVQLGLDSAQASYVAGTMTLSAMLSFGARQSAAPVLRTRYLDNTTTATFIVPTNFAKRVWLYRYPTSVSATVTFRDTAADEKYEIGIAAATSMTTPIPISDDIYDIVVTLSGTGDARLIYEIQT